MEYFLLLLCVLPAWITAITITSNGNSPGVKMVGGLQLDVNKGVISLTAQIEDKSNVKSNNSNNKTIPDSNNLSINDRYRRLIPYMTFYYANDLTAPTTEHYSTQGVEVEKVQLVESSLPVRGAKKLSHIPLHNIPRYHGNRLTKYNNAAANPGRIYKDIDPLYRIPTKQPVYESILYDQKYSIIPNNGKHHTKPNHANIGIKHPSYLRKPNINLFHTQDNSGIKYYVTNNAPEQKFKLIPYDQTPPVSIVPYDENIYESYKKPEHLQVAVTDHPIYTTLTPIRPHSNYNNAYVHHALTRNKPMTISESYYEKSYLKDEPVIEGGFKPIIPEHISEHVTEHLTEAPTVIVYKRPNIESQRIHHDVSQAPAMESSMVAPEKETAERPDYYHYISEQPSKPMPQSSNPFSLSDILYTLQKTKYIPKPVTKDNVESSIQTLLQVLNTLRAAPAQNEVQAPVLSTPKPFLAKTKVVIPSEPVEETISDDVDLTQEPYLAPVNPPAQNLDDYSPMGATSQTFPLPLDSEDDGGTPGKAGIDYPILTTIPETKFDCKTQRYKGFFADPETRCQVWHYCDLNGGQASFLCPNGTIFSQAALTCDWWFNVRCASTTQLYVLNESLYKYILPHSPKFPEDFSGPLVDKYLTLKFKEMEDQFRKNKNRQSNTEKTIESNEEEPVTEAPEPYNSDEMNTLAEAKIIVETAGITGNIDQRQT